MCLTHIAFKPIIFLVVSRFAQVPAILFHQVRAGAAGTLECKELFVIEVRSLIIVRAIL